MKMTPSKNLKKIKINEDIICPPRKGDIVEGKIIARETNSVFLDLGVAGIGIIYGKEFNEAKDVLKDLKIGDKVIAKITNLENENGYRELSIKEAVRESAWDELIKIKEREETLDVLITRANRGGLLAHIMGISAFLPASQLSEENYPKIEKDPNKEIVKELQKLIGKKLKVKIFDLDLKGKKIILSEKLAKTEKIKEVLEKYKVGEEIKGEITGITNFGAFLKFGKENLEGLIHISEISNEPIKDITKFLKIGQKVKAKIIEIIDERIYLSFIR